MFNKNQKGSYTALIGLMVLILVASVSFTALGKSESIKGKTLIKIAGDVKRTYNKTQFLLDASASAPIAERTIQAYKDSLKQDCLIEKDYRKVVSNKFTQIIELINKETSISCSFSIRGEVASGQNFPIDLSCSRTAFGEASSIDYSATTSGSFVLNKTVKVDGKDGCKVTVTDTPSGLVEAEKSEAPL